MRLPCLLRNVTESRWYEVLANDKRSCLSRVVGTLSGIRLCPRSRRINGFVPMAPDSPCDAACRLTSKS